MALSDRDRALVLETFLAEAADHLRGLEEKLVALEARSTDADLLQEIFRSVHSLKGDAAMVGFPHVADFAHEVEDAPVAAFEQFLRRGGNITLP